ncbi:MAG TPA: sugar ABC transporter substrate-binding protein [Bacteroidota bacterium]|nr:sugar ABC transporter substrate-binding protein [Bacteroidota bacterium]
MSPLRLAAVVVLALTLLSCGGKKQQEDGITLTLYHWMEQDRRLWEEEIIKPFEESHPGIHVILQTSPYALYVTKSLTSIASGNQLADLMLAEDWFGQELIHKNYPLNLIPYVNRDLVVDDFNSETFTEWRGVAQREDELYGFTACLGLTVLFYNKDLFDRAGVPYPDTSWTYEDLRRVGARLTVDANGDGIPELWGLSFDVHYTGFETVLYSFGGRTLTDDLQRADLSEPATLRGLHFIRDLFLDRKIASNTTSFVNPWDSFVGQRAAMILIGSHGSINLEGSPIRWDLTFPPKGPDGRRSSRRFTMAFMIPRNSPHPDEAWQLLHWILTKSPVEQLHTQYLGMMPTYKPFTQSTEWLTAPPIHNRHLLVELEQQYSFPLFTPGWQEWRDNNLTPEMLLMIQGKKPLEECVRDAERRINAVLDRVYKK